MRVISKNKIKGFYQSEITKDMVKTLKKLGGLHTEEDFYNQKTLFSKTITNSYRNLKIHQCPLNSPGLVVLMMMAMTEKLNIKKYNPSSFERYHLQAEISKICFEVKETIFGDPNFNNISKKDYLKKIKNLFNLAKLVKHSLETENKIQSICSSFVDAKGSMFLGRGYSFPIALEGALKLKELAYVHAEGYPAGEMKHGPLALIEDGMPVVVIAPRDQHYKKTISNMQEVIARGAKVLLVTNKSKDEVYSENIWQTIEVENTEDDLFPFLVTIPLQKLAYYSALKKGYDIDKPRNLAKSVTVE